MPRGLVRRAACIVLAMFAAAGAARGPGSDVIDTEKSGAPPTPEESLRMIRGPADLVTGLYAAEPRVQNPIAATVDADGRLWVAENLTYAEPALRYDHRLSDRVTVLDDADDDGVADGRQVAIDGLNGLTGLAVGRGGVWLMCPPRLLFVADRHVAEGTDPAAAAAAAETALDGFEIPTSNHHNVANGLSWGPDGWLYGRCGASAPAAVGPPGAAGAERVPVRGGMWRYHPRSRIFEQLVHGTTNPWGHDWDAHGECFFINTVNGHLWHLIPGAHFTRPHTIDPNPHVHSLIDQHADHFHFDTAKRWDESRDGKADAHGGGHAHSGVVIVPHEPPWPESLRGRLLTLNLHGRRINVERLEPRGSGFVGRHEPDLLFFDDPWFRGIDLVPLAPGRLAVLDWCDAGECHEHTGVHRSSGRIITLGPRMPAAAGVIAGPAATGWRDDDFAAALGGGEWRARTARQVLADRHQRGDDVAAARRLLGARLTGSAATVERLRALWCLWASGGVPEADLIALGDDADPVLRLWAVRLVGDAWPLDTVLSARPRPDVDPSPAAIDLLMRLADDPAPRVRLALASTLQRLPTSRRAALAARLAAHPGDASDHNLPHLVWYGLIPLADDDPQSLVDVWMATRWPSLRRSIVRRLGESALAGKDDAAARGFGLLLTAAAGADAAARRELLDGIGAALDGRRGLAAPAGWAGVLEKARRDGPPSSDLALAISVRFGDAAAGRDLTALVDDARTGGDRRAAALAALVAGRAEGYQDLCRRSITAPGSIATAAAGLLIDGSDADARLACEALPRAAGDDRIALLAALAARPSWAAALLDAVEAGRLPRDTIDPLTARSIAGLGDTALIDRLDRAGVSAPDRGGRQRQVAAWRDKLTPAVLGAADLEAGRTVWSRQCAGCHRLHGAGGTLGPDLSGAGRRDLDYVLGNILDPSAVVTADYRLRQVLLDDGRVLAGIVVRRTPAALTLRMPSGDVVLDAGEVEAVHDTKASIMPEGLLDGLGDDAVRDLVAYLMADEPPDPHRER